MHHPIELDKSGHLGIGLHARFQELRSSLFSRDTELLLSITVSHPLSPDKPHVSSSTITNKEAVIESLTQEAKQSDQDTIFVIPQEYSWGRFKLTESTFQAIMDRLAIFQDFLVVATAYGIKTHEDERIYHGWRSCFSDDQCSRAKHEICYNIPYMEKHHRKLSDPWSQRQCGVYQQLQHTRRSCRYVMLNLTDQPKRLLEKSLGSRSFCCYQAIHAQLLALLTSNWPDYVEYLSTALTEHGHRAYYSSIDKPDKHDFTATYQNIQDLYLLQTKIECAIFDIDACIKIGQGCQKFSQVHANLLTEFPPACSECNNSMNVYKVGLNEQAQNIRRLDRRLKNILDLFSKVLIFRNDVVAQNATRQSGITLEDLLTLTGQSRVHQETLTQLLEAVKADSVLLKALSIMATAYLPASLIATIYSSNLVQSVVPSSDQQPSQLALSPQFWTYVAISLPLIVLTLLWTAHLDRRSHLKIAKEVELANKRGRSV